MELKSPLNDMVYLTVKSEVGYAERKHGEFPRSLPFVCSIIGEEFGEVCKAVNDYNDRCLSYEQPFPQIERYCNLFQIALELSHTAVTAMRAMDVVINAIGDSKFREMYENFCVTREEEWQGLENDSQQE